MDDIVTTLQGLLGLLLRCVFIHLLVCVLGTPGCGSTCSDSGGGGVTLVSQIDVALSTSVSRSRQYFVSRTLAN